MSELEACGHCWKRRKDKEQKKKGIESMKERLKKTMQSRVKGRVR